MYCYIFLCIHQFLLQMLLQGDVMKNSEEVLSSILKTTQMGQIGIRSLLNQPLNIQLQDALKSQLAEYDKIETQANEICKTKGYQVEQLNPAIRKMTDYMTSMRLKFGDIDSKAAAMMIQGNTRGIIKTLKNLHHYKKSDEMIVELSEKLLTHLESNSKEMQGFV